jgi:hypothetical protein
VNQNDNPGKSGWSQDAGIRFSHAERQLTFHHRQRDSLLVLDARVGFGGRDRHARGHGSNSRELGDE